MNSRVTVAVFLFLLSFDRIATSIVSNTVSFSSQSDSEEETSEIDYYGDSDEVNEKTVCGNVTGWWRNEHGSDVYLKLVSKDGTLRGRYKTAVETKPGAAGNKAVTVFGRVSESLISFNAVWGEGSSMATWVGQCYRSPQSPSSIVIHTSWIHKSTVPDCSRQWMSNRIGQETFTRVVKRRSDRTQRNVHEEAPKSHK